MQQVVQAEHMIDEAELKTMDSYSWRCNHMLESSGIPNYDLQRNPLPHNYFEDDPRERYSSKKRVTPHVSSQGYRRFNNSTKVEAQIVDDLIEFERYAKFDVASLEAVQIREAIIEDMNIATPAAMFEGSLNDWQDLAADR